MKQKRKKRGRVLAVLLAVMVLITSFSFNMVSAEENAEADKVQSETIADPSSNVAEQQDVTDGDKEPEKDVEKDLETERQMKQHWSWVCGIRCSSQYIEYAKKSESYKSCR